VVRIEFVVDFSYPWRCSVWLITRTDEQRDALGALDPEREVVREVLEQVGIPPEQLEALTVTSQSQETVGRDYNGSWFYALR
jgi:hypothetical protein